MKYLATNLAIKLMAAGLTSFWAVYLLFGQASTLQIASGLLLGGYIVIALTWLPPTLVAVFRGTRTGADVLAFGIFSIGLFGAAWQAWARLYHFLGRADALIHHWTHPMLIWGLFWATVVVILAPGTHAGEMPKLNKLYLVATGMIGMLAAGVAIGFSLANATPM